MAHVLDPFIPVCEAVAQLFWPHVEAVLHDLSTDQIHYVANSYSKRRKGDSSLNDPAFSVGYEQPVIGPYGKVNWNGHRLKSVTTVLRDNRRKAIGLLCINHDVEAFSGVIDQIKALVEIPASSATSAPLLSQDWREAVNSCMREFLAWRKTTLAGLTKADTDDLLKTLDDRGIFDIRNAVPYVADVLRVSRATIYNRLTSTRKRVQEKTKNFV